MERLISLLGAVIFSAGVASAANLASWDFDNHAADIYDEDTQTSQDLNLYTNNSFMLASANIAGDPSSLVDGAYWNDTMGQYSSEDDLAATLTSGRYFTLSATAAAGQLMNLDQLVLNLGTLSSYISGSEVIDVAVVSGGQTIATDQISDGNELITMTINLSTNSSFQGISSAEFKIVAYNATSYTDRFAIGYVGITDGVNDIELSGSIVPEAQQGSLFLMK